MKVKELIENLQMCDPEDEVILKKDAEGNGYSPLSSLYEGLYVPDSTWSGDVYLRELTKQDKKNGFTEEDLYSGYDGQNAIILEPEN